MLLLSLFVFGLKMLFVRVWSVFLCLGVRLRIE